MLDKLKEILLQSELQSLFKLRTENDNTMCPNPHVCYRVNSNIYKIRSFELWGNKDNCFFRIYHAKEINEELEKELNGLPETKKSTTVTIDYVSSDYTSLAKRIKNILLDTNIINKCRMSSKYARTSRFEGLELPDIDTSDSNVLGQVYTWRDIISIYEDESSDNKLKEILSKKGIYIQRSRDGKSRYIGSAYGEEGIIGRWMKHLNSNGDAQHLNLFVLENGYNEVVFSVIEFYEADDIIKREKMWKDILGTINYGPYNGVQLNNN
ncbi:MAG: GIY-YIG nuclease family protein [Cellulosilyticum sp.]|nr:GIY-YIG nuclease family protein [Cellulosilyticum sp.]